MKNTMPARSPEGLIEHFRNEVKRLETNLLTAEREFEDYVLADELPEAEATKRLDEIYFKINSEIRFFQCLIAGLKEPEKPYIPSIPDPEFYYQEIGHA